jgi:hypothetical protein
MNVADQQPSRVEVRLLDSPSSASGADTLLIALNRGPQASVDVQLERPASAAENLLNDQPVAVRSDGQRASVTLTLDHEGVAVLLLKH